MERTDCHSALQPTKKSIRIVWRKSATDFVTDLRVGRGRVPLPQPLLYLLAVRAYNNLRSSCLRLGRRVIAARWIKIIYLRGGAN